MVGRASPLPGKVSPLLGKANPPVEKANPLLKTAYLPVAHRISLRGLAWRRRGCAVSGWGASARRTGPRTSVFGTTVFTRRGHARSGLVGSGGDQRARQWAPSTTVRDGNAVTGNRAKRAVLVGLAADTNNMRAQFTASMRRRCDN